MQNKMIIQAEAAIDAKVSPKDKAAYERIVLAGTKVMFEDKAMHAKLIQGLQQAPEVKTVVDGIIGILGLLFQQSRNTMPGSGWGSTGC